jgi:hypothetical protein
MFHWNIPSVLLHAADQGFATETSACHTTNEAGSCPQTPNNPVIMAACHGPSFFDELEFRQKGI